MPDIRWNYETWNNNFDWEGEKPGWCEHTSGNEIDWRCVMVPRIASFLPTSRILEIAPGHGRWTHFLAQYCKELSIVDLAPACIEACKKRFANYDHISYHVTDGLHLDFLKPSSIDFVFSFDSLVHCDLEVLDSYLSYLQQALSPNGVGFFHHSNGAALPQVGQPDFSKIPGGRSTNVSAEIFEQLCRKHQLRCIGQEIINWNSADLIDCLSLFCRPGSRWDRANQVFVNRTFLETRQANKKLFGNYVF